MRYLLKASFSAEDGNRTIKNGSLGKNMKEILGELKPEAAYFGPDQNGKRTAFLIVNNKPAEPEP